LLMELNVVLSHVCLWLPFDVMTKHYFTFVDCVTGTERVYSPKPHGYGNKTQMR